MKDALWGGGGTHRSWPGGRGGRPRALIPGEGQGRVGLTHRSWLGGRGVREAGQGLGGGCKGFGSGEVGGRGTGSRDGANFATNAMWGGGGGTHWSWPGGRGVDQGPWLQERVGGGVGAMAVPNKGEGWGLVVQEKGQGRVGLAVGGVQGLRLRGGRW